MQYAVGRSRFPLTLVALTTALAGCQTGAEVDGTEIAPANRTMSADPVLVAAQTSAVPEAPEDFDYIGTSQPARVRNPGNPQEQSQPQSFPAVPSAIQVPPGYEVQVVAQGLDYPTDITFGRNGEIFVSEAGGHTYGTAPPNAPEARILQIMPGGQHRVVYDKTVPLDVLRRVEFGKPVPAAGIVPPLTGVTYNHQNGLLYVASRQRYATLNLQTGEWRTIIDGLPSWGEFLNTKPIFDREGKMWFVQSSQGNSGTIEAHWIKLLDIFNKPDAHEVPCEDITVTGVDYFVPDKLESHFPGKDKIRAEVYAPLGVDTTNGQTLPGKFWCNGAVYRTNPDGTNPERMAWGLRSVFGLNFSPAGRLMVTQNSANIMKPRPLYDDWETILEIKPGLWYGWPDYYSGLPITDQRFRRPNDPEWKGNPEDHKFALTGETRARLLRGGQPPQPLIRIQPHAATQGFAFGKPEWGMSPENELLVAEWGAIIPYYKDPGAWPGFRVSHVNLATGETHPFLINKCGKPAWIEGCEGGLRRPIMAAWGPDDALYVVDFGVVQFTPKGMNARPDTGVIWKVARKPSR